MVNIRPLRTKGENGWEYHFYLEDVSGWTERRKYRASDYQTAFAIARNDAAYRTDKTGVNTVFYPLFEEN